MWMAITEEHGRDLTEEAIELERLIEMGM
jgi:hypothetical protein